MSDIVKRLEDMFFWFGTESLDDAANRRIQTAKDAADEIKKLRAWVNKMLQENRAMEKKIEKAVAIIINARAALGEKE